MTNEAEREQIARIIDPDAWHHTLPTDGCGQHWMGRRKKALAKADAIMARSPPPALALRQAAAFLLWQKDRGGPVAESLEAWDALRAALQDTDHDTQK